MARAVGAPLAAVAHSAPSAIASASRPRLLAYPQLVIGGVAFALLLVGAVLGPLVVGYSPLDADFSAALSGPSASHVFGTDQLGRDSLSRAMSGARLSLLVAGGTVILSLGGGVLRDLLDPRERTRRGTRSV